MGTKNMNLKGGKKFQKMQMRAKAKVTYCCGRDSKMVKVNGRYALQCRVCKKYLTDVRHERVRIETKPDDEVADKKVESKMRKLTRKYLGF